MKTTSSIFVILILVLISINSCTCFCKKGDAKVVNEIRQISDIEEIDINGQAEVFIKQGSTPSLKLTIDSSLLEYVRTDVSGKELTIKDRRCFKNLTDYKVYITVSKLSKIYINGSVRLKGDSIFKVKDLYIKNRGSGEVQLNIEVDKLEVDLAGSGNIKLAGRAIELEADVDGAGTLDAFAMQVKEADVSVDGAGSCKIDVSERFYANVGGSGKIFYKGNPKKVKTDISGSGTIQAR
jgi:hypothetical protein